MLRNSVLARAAVVALAMGGQVGCDGGGSGEADSSSTGMDAMSSTSTTPPVPEGGSTTTGSGSDEGTTTSTGSSSSGSDSSSSSGDESTSSSGGAEETTAAADPELKELSSFDPATCVASRINPCDGEEDHFIAARLVPEAYPFTVVSVAYGMLEETNAAGLHCNSALAHVLDVYVMDATADLPPTEPDVLFHLLVHPAVTPAAEGETRDLELNLDEPIVVEEGQHLVVAIQNAGEVDGPGCSTEGDTTCVATCGGPDFAQDEHFWSNAAEAPFPWATLSSFGISEGANIRAIGYY